ncbi:hypothetical protein L208DRAFT_1253972 [Tricholoma matsutake]|nr:hypothetical protein L208DRAFT_1253972 [Tricholoma matsutake 945]
MAQYQPEQLGFLDEVSKDERTSARRRGRSMKGFRAVKKGVFVRGRRFSAEGLLTVDGMVSNTVVEGSMTRARFLEYLEHSVLPLCTPFPGYLSVLVMDNARIHHGEEILELMQHFGNTMALTLEIICLLLNFRCPSRASSTLLTRPQSH